MKPYTTCLIFASILSFIITPRIYSQDPDAWEKNQTSYQPPEIVLNAIDIKKGMVVGEIGAGRGRYSVILAEKVGEKGHIYANDIDQESLDYLELRCKRDGIGNISIIRGEEKDPLLPVNKLDMIFMVNTFHHLSDPVEVLKNAYPALKPSGTFVIIEGVPGRCETNSSHATPADKLVSQVKKAGFRYEGIAAELKKDNIYIFSK